MENEEIPGITTTYYSPEPSSMFSMTNVFFLFVVMLLGALFYKMRKKNKNDDEYEFVKSDKNSAYEKFFNPFNRKKDNDDDFDKVL